MKINKHVNFESLLSNTASMEKIAASFNNNTPDSVAPVNQNKKTDNSLETGALAVGATAAGFKAYDNNNQLKKTVKELKQHTGGNKKKFSIKHSIKKTFKKIKNKILPPDKVGNHLRKKIQKLEDVGKSNKRIAYGLAAGSAGIAAYDAYKNRNMAKTASFDETSAEVAKDVQEQSTPTGGAKHRAEQGALVGGLAGLMYGAAKKGKVKGSTAKLIRSLWHGTSGAVWGGAAAGAATYAKKKIFPDTAHDKQVEYEKRMQKVASVNTSVSKLASIAAGTFEYGEAEKEAGIMSTLTGLAKRVAGQGAKEANNVKRSVRRVTSSLPPKLTGAASTKDAMVEAQRRINAKRGMLVSTMY